MFCQRPVVRNDRHIQTQLESERSRIAKAPARYESDTNPALANLIERSPVSFSQLPA